MKIMELSADQDQALKEIFDSCDSTGLGFIAQEDFKMLCKKVCLESHYISLNALLFPATNIERLLPYDTFRRTLIAYIDANPFLFSQNVYADADIPGEQEKVDTDAAETHSREYDTVHNTDSQNTSSNYQEILKDPDVLEKDSRAVALHDVSNTSERKSPAKKKYGRTSIPDEELLVDVCGDNPDVLHEIATSPNTDSVGNLSPDNNSRRTGETDFEKENTPVAMREEEFIGDGKDEYWRNPDSEWMNEMNTNTGSHESPAEHSSLEAVKQNLERAWARVVGDTINEGLTESKLGPLCLELNLNVATSDEDISAIFGALDNDGDGLVTFREFSELMASFPVGAQDDYDVVSMSDVRDCDVASAEIKDCLDENGNESVEHSAPRSKLFCEDGDNEKAFDSTCDKDVLATPLSTSSKTEVATPSRSPVGRLSLESDTSPLCPPVASVEPRQLAAINKGRRRRRSSAVAASNPGGTRHQKRKPSRGIPLPHHHPARVKKTEESPLSYLVESHGRYVSLDTLCHCWEMDGIEDSAEVLDALQLSSSEPSVSIEALTEVFEMEFDQNLIEKAAYLLYKRGIDYYRTLNSQGEEERHKLAGKMSLLSSQLQEQEERCEKAESSCATKLQDEEYRYKNEIRDLSQELASTRNKLKECERKYQESKREGIEDLNKKYEEVRKSYRELKEDNDKLSKLWDETQLKLEEAEEVRKTVVEEVKAIRARLTSYNHRLSSQRSRNLQMIELWRQNEDDFRVMYDGTDELVNNLDQNVRRWTPHQLKAPTAATTDTTSQMSSISGATPYCTAYEDRLQSTRRSPESLSTTSDEYDEIPSPINKDRIDAQASRVTRTPSRISLSNEFAFLSPSTTRSVSRVRRSDYLHESSALQHQSEGGYS